MNPETMIVEIDEHFKIALKAIKTVDAKLKEEQWDIWSGVFNRPLYAKIKATNDPQLKYVYAYWWNRSHLLRAYSKSRIGLIAKKKKLIDEGITLCKLVKRVPEILERFDEKKVETNIDKLLLSLGLQNEEVNPNAVSFSEVEKKKDP